MSVVLRKCTICGLEAKNENDLELFERNKNVKYGRINRCKKCRRKPPKPYLKKCRMCGLEAKTETDLINFEKNNRFPFGRMPICKGCFNKNRRERDKIIHPKTDFTIKKNILLKKLSIPIICYFCGLEIKELYGKSPNSLCFHSLDFNHYNWDSKNKVPSHKKCHNSYHSQNSSIETRLKISIANSGNKCYNWKGDNAKPSAKKLRKHSETKLKEKIKLLKTM